MNTSYGHTKMQAPAPILPLVNTEPVKHMTWVVLNKTSKTENAGVRYRPIHSLKCFKAQNKTIFQFYI